MCSRLLGRNVKSYFISEFNLVGRSTNRFRDWILGVHAGCDRILFGIHRNGMADSESIGECYNRRTTRCTPSPRSTVLTCVESTFSGWVIANVRPITIQRDYCASTAIWYPLAADTNIDCCVRSRLLDMAPTSYRASRGSNTGGCHSARPPRLEFHPGFTNSRG